MRQRGASGARLPSVRSCLCRLTRDVTRRVMTAAPQSAVNLLRHPGFLSDSDNRMLPVTAGAEGGDLFDIRKNQERLGEAVSSATTSQGGDGVSTR